MEAEEVEKFLTWDGTGLLYHISNTEKYGWLCTSGAPIRNDAKEVCGFILVDVTTNNIRADLINFAVKISIALLAVTALISWFLYRYIRKSIVRPLNALAGAASSYAQDKKSGAPATDHFSALNIRSGSEMENLCLIMSDMEKDISEHEETIKKDAAEKERINTELGLARDIQASALPSRFPAFPERDEFDLYASMHAAKEVGGDFYDFFLVDPDHLALVIADVSGKGIPAALFMMTAKTLIKNQLMAGLSPAEALAGVNLQLCERNESKMFVTVWAALLEISTGRGVACNAGHENPGVRRQDSPFELLRYTHDMFLGVSRKAKYADRPFEMEPGDSLFVYTDGVTEAKNGAREMFGNERLAAALNRVADATPEELIGSVQQAVSDFVQDAPQFDDITMLSLKYCGPRNQGLDP